MYDQAKMLNDCTLRSEFVIVNTSTVVFGLLLALFTHIWFNKAYLYGFFLW